MINSTPLTIRRPSGPELKFPALTLARGEKLLLLGPSGCGKTTWLAALAGLLPPTEGRVDIEGVDIYALPNRRRDALRGRCFGFVFQTLHLLPGLTLRQNVMLAAPRGRADDVLARLGLTDKAQRRPHALSQGEQQRAAIARAVVNDPAVIIADEPTSALDDDNAQNVMALLESCARDSNAALIVATHDARLKPHFSRIITLAEVK